MPAIGVVAEGGSEGVSKGGDLKGASCIKFGLSMRLEGSDELEVDG